VVGRGSAPFALGLDKGVCPGTAASKIRCRGPAQAIYDMMAVICVVSVLGCAARARGVAGAAVATFLGGRSHIGAAAGAAATKNKGPTKATPPIRENDQCRRNLCWDHVLPASVIFRI